MTDFVKQLKEQVNIADIVGEHVRLRKTGSNHMGLCPFHAERSPSFSVSERKGIYYCFGCQKGDDAISFLQETLGLSFHDAIRELATRYNVKLPPEFAARRAGAGGAPTGREAEEKLEVFYKLNRFVAQFYHEKLLGPAGKKAREYLTGRGITEETIRKAYLGFAPDAWSELYDFLVEKQAPLDKSEELGLIRLTSNAAATAAASPGGRAHFDLFRNRLMIPVTDLRGRVIAFGGRSLGAGNSGGDEGPKYMNSPETPVFKKGSQLFGLFQAQKDIRADDACVVVEGFMDCLALQQHGIGYAVATLGTALTERQVALLKRFTKNIALLFDGDDAGREAQARAMEIFLNEDVVVRGVSLPDELDPDEFVRERGADKLRELLTGAPYLLDQRVLELRKSAGPSSEGRARALDQALPWIAKISSDTARLLRLQEIASIFDVPLELLERRVTELRSAAPKSPRAAAAAAAPRPAPVRLVQKPARQNAAKLDALDAGLLESLVRRPDLWTGSTAEELLEGVEAEVIRALASRMLESIRGGSWSGGGSSAGGAAAGGGGALAEALDWTDVPALKTLLTRALVLAEQDQSRVATPEQAQDLVQEARDLGRKLVRRGRERRKDGLRTLIRAAEGSGQTTEYSRLMNEYNELVRSLDDQTKEAR